MTSKPTLPAKFDGKVTFDAGDVAEIFQETKWVIYDWAKRGILPAIDLGPKRKKWARLVIEKKLGA
jgi:hypothetical protein